LSSAGATEPPFCASATVDGGWSWRGLGQTATVVSFLLSVTFACGVFIAVAHVLNRRFIAPVYDVVANLTAFGCAVAASVLLSHAIPAILAGVAIVCWLVLAQRTVRDRRERRVGH
jgi:riboflavin transporter FmnP